MPAHASAPRTILATLCVALWIVACSDGPTRPGSRLLPAAALETGTGADASAACSPVADRPFLADQDLPIGSVGVANDEQTLFITMRTEDGWMLSKTHVFVGTDAEDIPLSNGDNPTPGKFPLSARHADGTTEYTYAVPLSELDGATTAVIAAHADALLGDDKEGAWADGTMITEGGSWGTYFTYDVVDCLSRLVTVDAGGTLALGDVTFQVPPGAVQQDVQITIRPIDVSELNLAAGVTGTTASGPAAGASSPADIDLSSVIPVPGTAYELGPTGLVFDPDALPTITVHYDDANVEAAGLVESLLHVLILDGIFDDAGGVVDAAANTVTAQIHHFSQIFLGAEPPTFADLETRELHQSPVPGKVGSRLEFSTDVINHGPDATTGATFVYQAFGDVVLGDVFGSCTEIQSPIFADVAIECAVAALDADQNDGIETLQLIPQSPGTVTVWATVGEPTGAVDLVPENDRAEIVASVEPAVLADLAMIELTASDDTARIGAQLEYQAKVENLGPDEVSGASVTWAASGAVELGTIPGGCSELGAPELTFYDVGIRCDVAPLASGEQASLPTFQLSPTAAGDLLIDVGIGTLSGETEADASNNFKQTTTTILPDAEVDYALQSLTESDDPVKAYATLTYTGVVALNSGPLTPVNGGTYQLFVNGQFGVLSMSPGCTKLERSVPAGANFTCDLGNMDTGTSKSFAIVLEPHAAPQTISANALVTPPLTVTETNPGDETGDVSTTVEQLSADLFLTLLTDDPDPVDEGAIVTYGVYALSGGSDDDMPRVVVQFRVAGDAELVSMPPDFAASCTDLSGASTSFAVVVNCDIEPLQAGIASPHLEFGVRALSGPELSAEAEIFPVTAYALDPDDSDNLQTQTTTVQEAAPSGQVYVVNAGPNTVSVVDRSTDAVVASVAVGTNPEGAGLSPGGSELWVLNRGDGSASVISTATNGVIGTIAGVASDPFDLAFSPDGSRAYITDNDNGLVRVVDVATRSVVATITGLSTSPRGIAILPNGSKAYVATGSAIDVIDLSTNTRTKSIAVGGNALHLAAAGNSTVYFTEVEPFDGTNPPGLVRTIDTSTDALVGSGIRVGFDPYGIALSSAGTTAYVPEGRNRIYFVDLTTGTATAMSTGVGTNPYYAAATPDDQTLYVSFRDAGTLAKIDVSTMSIVGTPVSTGAFPGRVVIR